MEKDRLLSMIGLCKKANMLVTGFDVVAEAVAEGRALLLLTTEDLSARSLKNIKLEAEKTEVEHAVISVNMHEIAQRIGRVTGILAITNQGFADSIKKLLAKE